MQKISFINIYSINQSPLLKYQAFNPNIVIFSIRNIKTPAFKEFCTHNRYILFPSSTSNKVKTAKKSCCLQMIFSAISTALVACFPWNCQEYEEKYCVKQYSSKRSEQLILLKRIIFRQKRIKTSVFAETYNHIVKIVLYCFVCHQHILYIYLLMLRTSLLLMKVAASW